MDDRKNLLHKRNTQERAAIGRGSLNATFIFDVCRNGDYNSLKDIINQRKDVIKLRDQNNRSLLHYCSESKDVQCAQLLLDASSELLVHQDNDGYSVLHLAVINSNKLLLRYLCQQFNDDIEKQRFVNCVDSEGHTAFHWATVCSEIECLDTLHNEGATAAVADNHGAYPLHYASQLCALNPTTHKSDKIRVELLKKLLSFTDVDVNCKDNDGRTPLLWASSAGNCEAILTLINANADIAEQDNDGLTALHCAASRGFVECMETLLTLGAEIDQMDSNGCSPLFYAVTLGHADCVHVLLQNGAEPNRQDCKGRTAAHCGAAKGQLETLKILAQHGANVWMRSVRGDLPLHDAIKSGRKELVWWLLHQQPESVNITNTFGRTPLHLAAVQNNVEMCKVLIDSGADVNACMKSKGHLLTPLDAALQRGYRSCGKFLLLHGALPSNKLNLSNKPPRFGVTGESLETKRSDIGVSVSLLSERIGTVTTNSRTESSTNIRGINLPAIHQKERLTSSKRIQAFTEGSISPEFRTNSKSPNEPIVRNQSIITNVYLQSGSGKRTIPPINKKVKKTVVKNVETVSERSETTESLAVINNADANKVDDNCSPQERITNISIKRDPLSSIEDSVVEKSGHTLTDDSFIREDITIDLSSKDEADISSNSRNFIFLNPYASHFQAIEESSASSAMLSDQRRCIRRSSDGDVDYAHLTNSDGKMILIVRHTFTPFTSDSETRIIEIDETSNTDHCKAGEDEECKEQPDEDTIDKTNTNDSIDQTHYAIVDKSSSSDGLMVKNGDKIVERLKTSEGQISEFKNEREEYSVSHINASNNRNKSLIPRLSTSSTKSRVVRQSSIDSDANSRSSKGTPKSKLSSNSMRSMSLKEQLVPEVNEEGGENHGKQGVNIKEQSSIDSVSSKRTPRVSASSSKSKPSAEHSESIKSKSFSEHKDSNKSTLLAAPLNTTNSKYDDSIKSVISDATDEDVINERKSHNEVKKADTSDSRSDENIHLETAKKSKELIKSDEDDENEEKKDDKVSGQPDVPIDKQGAFEISSMKRPSIAKLSSESSKSDSLGERKDSIKSTESNQTNVNENISPLDSRERHCDYVDTINNNDDDQRCEICSKRGSTAESTTVHQSNQHLASDQGSDSLIIYSTKGEIQTTDKTGNGNECECDHKYIVKNDHIEIVSNEDNNFDDRESDAVHEQGPDISSMKSKFGHSLPTSKSTAVSHTTVSDHAKKSTHYDGQRYYSQRTSSFDESILTETSRLDIEPKHGSGMSEREEMASNYGLKPKTEIHYKANDETLHEIQSIGQDHNGSQNSGHLINGSQSKRKQWSRKDSREDITLSVVNKNGDIIADKKREDSEIYEIKFNYEITATVDNESGDESSSDIYNKEIPEFGSDTSSEHGENALDEELTEHLRRIRQMTTRFGLNNEWELQRNEYDKDSVKTRIKSRSDSRCSHKLHYKSHRAHIGPVDLSHVTAKVDTRGQHLLKQERRAFDGKHKGVSRCNCVPADIDGRQILQTMEKSLRKYQVERKLFEELQSLKRCQIRTSRANEALLVKRLAEKFRRETKVPGMQEFSGAFTYRNYEKFLYDQLRLLSASNQQKVLPLITAVSDENISLSCLKQALDTSNALDNYSQMSNLSRRGSLSAGHLSTFDLQRQDDEYLQDENSLLDISSIPSIAGHQSPPEYKATTTSSSYINHISSNEQQKLTATKQMTIKREDQIKQRNGVRKNVKIEKVKPKPKPNKPDFLRNQKSDKKNVLSELDKFDKKASNYQKTTNEVKRRIPVVKSDKYQIKTTAKYDQVLRMRQHYRRECLKPEERIEPLEASRNRPKFKRTKMNIPLKEDICVPEDEIAERWQRIKHEERSKLKQKRQASHSFEVHFIYVLSAPKRVESLQSNAVMDRSRFGRRPLSRTHSDSTLHVLRTNYR